MNSFKIEAQLDKYSIKIEDGGSIFTINNIDMTNGEWNNAPYSKNMKLVNFIANSIVSKITEGSGSSVNFRTLDMEQIYRIFNDMYTLVKFAKSLVNTIAIPPLSEDFARDFIDGIENNVNSFNIIQKAILYTIAGHPKADFCWIFEKSDQSVKIYEGVYANFIKPEFVSDEVMDVVKDNFYTSTKMFWNYQEPFKLLIKKQRKQNIKDILGLSDEEQYERVKTLQTDAVQKLDYKLFIKMLANWYENNKVERIITATDIKKYVKEGGVYCPYCDSANLIESEISKKLDTYTFCVSVECEDCKNKWTEEFNLTTITVE